MTDQPPDSDREPGDDQESLVEPEAEPDRLDGRRRVAVFAICGVVIAVALVVLAVGLRSDRSGSDTTVDAWAPYWALDVSLPELPDRAESLRDLSPFWFAAKGAESIVPDTNASTDQTEAFLAAARRDGLRLVPSIVDGMARGAMAALLADPAQRTRHVDALAGFAESGDFDGLDIDYEQFAFADDRSTWATTRPHWVAFITELADRLHRDGRTLTVSIPPVYDTGRTDDSGYWVYDYEAIGAVVDRIRVMAYDYSTGTPGPIAPLDWVRQSIEGATAATGDPAKLALGVPLYGYNWVLSTTGTCPAGESGERTSVTARSARELADRRGAQPVYDDVTGEWSFTYRLELSDGTTACTQLREVRYVDSQGALERIALAKEAGFDGASLWALGYEDEALWPALTATSVPGG